MIHLSDDSIPFDSTTDEKTPKKGKKDKKKHKRSTTTHSMRIHSVLHSTARDKSFFTSSSGAFQRAISLFGNTFKVDRRESKLTLQPKCLTAIESGPNAGKCKKIDNSQLTCGIFDVPDQLKGPGVECKEKAGSCKTKTPSGAGVDADFIMFAGARDGKSYKQNTYSTIYTNATFHIFHLYYLSYRHMCSVWFISTSFCCLLWCRWPAP